jgi:hypothetical protein
MVSFTFLALVLPQSSEAPGRAEFQRFRLLLLSNLDGLVETDFGLLGARCWGLGAGVFGLVLTCLRLARDLPGIEALAFP